jgi:hypothetical protein
MAEEIERTIQIPIKITGTSTVNDSMLKLTLNDSKFKERVRGAVLSTIPMNTVGRGKPKDVDCEVGAVEIGSGSGFYQGPNQG